MEIKLKAESPEETKTLTLSNENLDNNLYVDLIVDGLELTVNLAELSSAICAFKLKANKKI